MNLATNNMFISNTCNTNITMATISIRIPDELKKKMEEYDEINWSSVMRKMLEEKVYEYYVLETIRIAEQEIKEGKYEDFKDFKKEMKEKYNLK